MVPRVIAAHCPSQAGLNAFASAIHACFAAKTPMPGTRPGMGVYEGEQRPP
jgi:hypothetical protein